MIDFYCKACHTYRVNRRKELVETWHLDGVTIVGMPFVRIGKKTVKI